MLLDEKYDQAFGIKVREAEESVYCFIFIFFFFFIVLPDEKT
jgi:hypothetical protein